MSIAFDAETWLASSRSSAAVALAAQPRIKPAPYRPLAAPTLKLKERQWNPDDSADILRDLETRSCVMLRNFLPQAEAERLAEIGWRSFDEVDANLARTAQGLPPVASPYCRLRDTEPDLRLGNERSLRAFGGMSVESVPFAGYQLFNILRSLGLLPLVESYIGGEPLVSGSKCTLRLGERESPVRHVFHQDGAFLGGASARTMNIWLALTDAGTDAPGL